MKRASDQPTNSQPIDDSLTNCTKQLIHFTEAESAGPTPLI